MQVAAKKTGKEVWDSLKARFVGEERVKEARLQILKSEFDAMKMKEDESIDPYARRLTGMSVQEKRRKRRIKPGQWSLSQRCCSQRQQS